MQDRSLELKNRFGNEADEVRKVHDDTASVKQKVSDANTEVKRLRQYLQLTNQQQTKI